MEQLVVINYETSDVDIYSINDDTNVDEDFLSSLGYNINSIYWMFGTNISINFKNILNNG